MRGFVVSIGHTRGDSCVYLLPMTLTRVSDAELLSRARTSRRAFAAFYDRYERAIAGYFMRRTRDPELAADLTAEVFAAAFVGGDRYRPDAKTAAPWLFTIAQNTLASSLRRGRVEEAARREIGVRAAVELNERSAARLEQAVAGDAWVSDMLRRLPADQQEAVRARVLEDKSYDQIAAELETSSLVVRKRVSRGLARLRQEVKKTS
jgi:RNA polymerase sigma factor (sigma-70 family)